MCYILLVAFTEPFVVEEKKDYMTAAVVVAVRTAAAAIYRDKIL
jgi:hypothetical protein